MTKPPCSSLCILEPGFHQCPLTRIASVSLVDHSVISWRVRPGLLGSGTKTITQYHHHDRRWMGGITSRRQREEKSPSNLRGASCMAHPHMISRLLKTDWPMATIATVTDRSVTALTSRATAADWVPKVWTGGFQKIERPVSMP